MNFLTYILRDIELDVGGHGVWLSVLAVATFRHFTFIISLRFQVNKNCPDRFARRSHANVSQLF